MKDLNPAKPAKIVDMFEILDRYPEFADKVGYSLDDLKKLALIMPEEDFDQLRAALELYVKMNNE
jgi:hypothetical protein